MGKAKRLKHRKKQHEPNIVDLMMEHNVGTLSFKIDLTDMELAEQATREMAAYLSSISVQPNDVRASEYGDELVEGLRQASRSDRPGQSVYLSIKLPDLLKDADEPLTVRFP